MEGVHSGSEDTKENLNSLIIMENEMVAVEKALKMELVEVKIETAECDIEFSTVGQSSWELADKDDSNEYGDKIISSRVENEHSYSKAWIKCDVQNGEAIEMQPANIKLEKDLKTEKLEIEEITEVILKNEDDLDISIDKNSEIVLNRISDEYEVEDKAELVKIEEMDLEMWKDVDMESCQDTDAAQLDHNHSNANAKPSIIMNSNECEVEDGAIVTLTAFMTNIEKSVKIEQMNLKMFMDMENCQDIHAAQFNQNHSHANTKSNILMNSSVKQKIVRKQDNVVRREASKKSFNCFNCNYTAFHKCHLINHMKEHKHQKNADSHSFRHKDCICMHCHARFKSKVSLDNHTIEKHPDSVASISDKIHKNCTYAATSKSNLARHMFKHPEIDDTGELNTCIHCNATFKCKVNLDEHIIRKHPDFIASVSRKIHKCRHCTYKTTKKNCIDKHTLRHPETAGNYKVSTCIHCNATFKTQNYLDEHTIRKHPDFIASVSRTIHECLHCTYATTFKNILARHMLKHSEAGGSDKLCTCIHCNATFKSKVNLDDHTIRKHSDCIASVSSKIHKCPHCTYATTLSSNLARHILKHPEATGSYKLSTCIHCNATFKSKQKLNDHTIREHPDFLASVSSKIHKCQHCTYATTLKSSLARHMFEHPEATGSYKVGACIHCNATFKSKQALDDHTIRKHSDSIASVSSKIHKCPHCTFASTSSCNLAKHILKHPEATGSYKLSTCIHCNATFKSKVYLDDHTIRKHLDLIVSVSSKIHKCQHCTYATTLKSNLARHIFEHHEATGSYKLRACIHCNATFKSKQVLDDHTIRKHPDFIASVSSKIHKCPHCTYATTRSSNLARHILKHSEATGSCKLSTCMHCNATFKNKVNLDDHTISKHPDFIASVSSKIHRCQHCTYATTLTSSLARHILKHPEQLQAMSSARYTL